MAHEGFRRRRKKQSNLLVTDGEVGKEGRCPAAAGKAVQEGGAVPGDARRRTASVKAGRCLAALGGAICSLKRDLDWAVGRTGKRRTVGGFFFAKLTSGGGRALMKKIRHR
jgi:hypothetical protein